MGEIEHTDPLISLGEGRLQFCWHKLSETGKGDMGHVFHHVNATRTGDTQLFGKFDLW